MLKIRYIHRNKSPNDSVPQNVWLAILICKGLAVFLDYLAYFPLAFVISEIFVTGFIFLVNTGWEESITKLITFTLRIKEETFTLHANDIVKFYFIWATITAIISKLLGRFIKLKVDKSKLRLGLILIIAILHLATIIKTGFHWVFIIFFVFTLLSLWAYQALNVFSNLLSGVPLMNKRTREM